VADLPRRRRDGALGVVGAVTIGAVAATLAGPAARADDPGFPTWNEVQRAKADGSAAAAESARITALLGDLQDRADAAGRTAAIAAERFHLAKLAEDAARERHAALARQADIAAATARTSRMRAGLLAASVARGGATDVQLMLDAGGANDFLHRLATVSQLSAQAQTITRRALADENEATALGAQADAAAAVLTDRAAAAQDALEEAERSVAAATEAVAAEQQHADRLVAQLAELRGTSTRLAAQYAAGVRAERTEGAQAGGAPSPSSSPGPAVASPAGSTSPAGPSTADAGPAALPAPSPRTPATSPDPVEPPPAVSAPIAAGEPNTAQAASAVAYARDQIGDPYRFAAAGPGSWDCSGLTMQAYASVGIGIGGHSATAQYDLAATQGKLVPYSQVRVGDLIFYTDGGGDMYHVAISSGAGMMIEAPYPGVGVREVPVRSLDRVAEVARPTATAA
jgi:cell wall-associated NlpC family hydrolase